MKKLICILLSALMILSVFSFSAVATEENKAENNETPAPDLYPEEDDEDLPSFFTLVGTPDLPPICNQGEIGCCASAAITYMQFTNAVSRYIREYEPEKTFEPATGELQYIMSPKWTYTLSGSGTAWVYDILKENGCLTMDKCMFEIRKTDGAFMFHNPKRPSQISTTAMSWQVQAGEMESAMGYRIKNYDQIWINNDYKVDGKVELTTTDAGQALLNRIKKAVTDGNVVVTGGFCYAWAYADSLTSAGNLASSKTEKAIVCSRGTNKAGHQVCIVGYDDDITCKYAGVTLKGAFLVANSWDTTWQNDGYCWMMYDALNERSEYEGLNFDDRILTMDQFCFIDWRTDIVNVMPDLYIEVEVTAKDRETVYIDGLRKDIKTGASNSYSYHMFTYSNHHPKFNIESNQYINFDGVVDGEATRAVISLPYNDLLDIPEGKSISDYLYGISIKARKESFTLHSLKLKNAEGTVIASVEIEGEGTEISAASQKMFFEEPVYKVTLPDYATEAVKIAGTDAYYANGSDVPLSVTFSEGYNEGTMVLKTQDGTVLTKDENGNYLLKVTADTVLAVEGEPAEDTVPSPSESDTPDDSTPSGDPASAEPTPSEDPAGTSSKPADNTTDKDKNGGLPLVVIILIAAVGVVAVGVVAWLVTRKKGNKK